MMNQKTTQQIYPELPEWSKRDDLGGLVPSEVRQALRAYADETCEARAAAASKPQVKEARERRRWLSDSFNRGTQTLDEATVSARAMAASMLVPRAALATPAQGTIPDPDDPWHGYPWFENTRAALASPAQPVAVERIGTMFFPSSPEHSILGILLSTMSDQLKIDGPTMRDALLWYCGVQEIATTPQPAAPAQAGEYPPLLCDYCGALTPDPWHSSGMLHGKMSKHIHSCDACCAARAAQGGAA